MVLVLHARGRVGKNRLTSPHRESTRALVMVPTGPQVFPSPSTVHVGLVHHGGADDRAIRHTAGDGLPDRGGVERRHLGIPLGAVELEHAVDHTQQQSGIGGLCAPPVIASIMWTPFARALLIWVTMVLGLLKSAVNVNGVVVDALLMRR